MESNQQDKPISDNEPTLIEVLRQNQTYLKTVLETQERILAHLEHKNIKSIQKEISESLDKHYEEIKDKSLNNLVSNSDKKDT